MFGVLMLLPLKPTSPHPRSSASSNTICGRGGFVEAWGVGAGFGNVGDDEAAVAGDQASSTSNAIRSAGIRFINILLPTGHTGQTWPVTRTPKRRLFAAPG